MSRPNAVRGQWQPARVLAAAGLLLLAVACDPSLDWGGTPRQLTPTMDGAWCIEHEPALHTQLTVEWRTEWETYFPDLDLNGGAFAITRDGETIRFNLDCSRDDVLCPAEIWPTVVELDDEVTMALPQHRCEGNLVEAGECGDGTPNRNCDPVCDGEVRVEQGEYLGKADKDSFFVSLDSELFGKTTDVCTLMLLSKADADLVTTGDPEEFDLVGVEMRSGIIELWYPAGCLLAADQTLSSDTRERIIRRPIFFRARFEAVRCDTPWPF